MNAKRTLPFLYLALLCAYPVLAAEPVAPYPSWGWHTMGWPAFWWIFPLLFLAFMMVMFFFMVNRGFGCMWHGRSSHGAGEHDRDPSRTALSILNERYAKGEIGKQEYEEKKAAIVSSR